MIEFQHVFKSWGHERSVLADVNFRIKRGEFILVSGASGAGKSTLLKLIAALDFPSRGAVTIKGQRVDRKAVRVLPWVRRAIGVVLQDTRLLYDRSAFDNVLLPLMIAGLDRTQAAARVRAAMERVGLADKHAAEPVTLSGGEQQRLAIARAIVNRPAILIADEPTANLDQENAQRIMRVLHDFHRAGVTTLVASHDHALVAPYATRSFVLAPGRFTDYPGTAP